MVRGSGEGTVRRGDYRNYYKGHMDKIKGEGGGGGGRWFQLGWGGGMFKLNTKFNADLLLFSVILNAMATQYTCSLNDIYRPH